MESIISMIEDILSDLAFMGLSSADTDIIARLRKAEVLCRELEMTSAVKLINELAEDICSAEKYSRLCCYIQCFSRCRDGMEDV